MADDPRPVAAAVAVASTPAPAAGAPSAMPVPARSGSILLSAPAVASSSHVNVCRPWISWKKGNMSEYVSKPRVFFDHGHQQIVLFTGSPPNKMWLSDRRTQTWMDFPVHLPPHNDIIGAQFSPDKSHVALRVSDKEVKVLSTATGEVVTARSCRGTSSRMVSVHWLSDPALARTASASCLFLLFVTNAGVELYELASERPVGLLPTGTSQAAAQAQAVKKLKHVKTATYTIVYHWLLLEENILLLVDARNVFQAYKISSKQITKVCKFELDCAGTSLHPPQGVQFHREQISLVWLYGRMVILFVNEQKGQLHLLSLTAPAHSEEVEQTHVFDLYAPGKYDVSNLDNVLVVHNTVTRVSMLFDVRSESKTTITEPLTIGPPLHNGAYAALQATAVNGGIDFFDPASMTAGVHGGGARPSSGMSSLAPANFHPYVKWTFLAPAYVWESTGDQQQGNLWTLQLNLQQIAFSWPHSKRTRLVDFLLKRDSVAAKHLVLQLILQIVCTEPTSLALLSRLFSLLNRMNYDHRMNPNATPSQPVNLANLPLLPPFSNPPSAANTAPPSQVASPIYGGGTRPPSHSVSPYKPAFGAGIGAGLAANGPGVTSPLSQGQLPSFGSRLTSPHHRTTSSLSFSSPSPSSAGAASTASVTDALAAASLASSAAAGAGHLGVGIGMVIAPPAASPLSFELDDSLSVLSCEMLDIAAMQAMPLSVEQNLHGYMLVSQMDVFLHVFARARDHIPLGQLIPVVVEYLRSIHRHFLKAEDVLNDLLVSLLLQAGKHAMFHQYLQYHILADSLPIANRLISCAAVYPPSYQLGIDMLYRLNMLPRLTKVLLQHGQVLAALQLVPAFRAGPGGAGGGLFETWGLFPRDFLQVAVNGGCDVAFFHTFRFFEQRNLVLRGSAAFVSGDGCDEFVHRFAEKFGSAAAESQPPPSLLSKLTAKPATPQFLNIGDPDDGFEEEDDDCEYLGPQPTIADCAARARLDIDGEEVDDESSSSSSLSPSVESEGPVRLPSPVDLSKEVVPATPAPGFGQAGEQEEDAQAESGLGADHLPPPILEALSPLPPVESDGSFGGSNNDRSKDTSSSSSAKPKKGQKFHAEPAM